MRHFFTGSFCCHAAFSITMLCIVFDSRPNIAQEPTVAGLHDLIVLKPDAQERGLPAVELKDVPGGDFSKIEIPRTVHVHPYYYSGDKEYQGPIISGGPTVVVANHPKTGEQMYIDITLPPGVPRIAYNKQGITYVYKDQRVEVKFQNFPLATDKVVVKQMSGKGLRRNVIESNQRFRERFRDRLANSRLVQSVKETGGDARDLLSGVRVSVGDLVASGGDTLRSVGDMIPGVTYLKSLAEQKPERDYASSIREAGLQKARAEVPFVPTNR